MAFLSPPHSPLLRFAGPSSTSRLKMTFSSPSTNSKIPRRVFLTLLSLLPLPVQARLTLSEATEEAKAARLSTPSLITMLELEEWELFRKALRGGPMSRVRASCTALVRDAGDDKGKEAKVQYDRLIKAVETVDYAVLGMERGKKTAVLELMQNVEVEFDGFLDTVGVKAE